MHVRRKQREAERTVEDDSFAPGAMEGLLEGPVYTKPAQWAGREVPPLLLSGDHAAIEDWRRSEVRPAPAPGTVLFSPPLSPQEETRA